MREFGESLANSVCVALQLASAEDLAAWNLLKEQKSTVVFRDRRGRRLRGAMTSAQLTDEVWGASATFTLVVGADQW